MSLENRKDPRFEVNMPVQISFAGKIYSGTISNISLGGCLIEGDFHIPTEEVVSLSISGAGRVSNAKVKVAWQTSHNGPERIGVCFWNMNGVEKIEMMEFFLRFHHQIHFGIDPPELD